MLKSRTLLLLLLSLLAMAMVARPVSAKTIMECPNGIPCGGMSADNIASCCHLSQTGRPASGCVIHSTSRIDYILQFHAVTIWTSTPALFTLPQLILPPQNSAQFIVVTPVANPPWKRRVIQGLAPRPPPTRSVC